MFRNIICYQGQNAEKIHMHRYSTILYIRVVALKGLSYKRPKKIKGRTDKRSKITKALKKIGCNCT